VIQHAAHKSALQGNHAGDFSDDALVSDWDAHQAIHTHPDLFVLHVWPRTLASAAVTLQHLDSVITNQCALDGRIVYKKAVRLTRHGLLAYLHHMHRGASQAVDPDLYWTPRAQLRVYVVRSNSSRTEHCSAGIRELYVGALSTRDHGVVNATAQLLIKRRLRLHRRCSSMTTPSRT